MLKLPPKHTIHVEQPWAFLFSSLRFTLVSIFSFSFAATFYLAFFVVWLFLVSVVCLIRLLQFTRNGLLFAFCPFSPISERNFLFIIIFSFVQLILFAKNRIFSFVLLKWSWKRWTVITCNYALFARSSNGHLTSRLHPLARRHQGGWRCLFRVPSTFQSSMAKTALATQCK